MNRCALHAADCRDPRCHTHAVPETSPPRKKPWVPPTVKRLEAGSAEPPGSELLP